MWVALAALVASCSSSATTSTASDTHQPARTTAGATPGEPDASQLLPPALQLLAGHPSPFARGDDRWEVWVCRIPLDTQDPTYGDPTGWRLDASPADLAITLQDGVTPWFETLSHGLYRPVFSAGGTVDAPAVGGDDGDNGGACVDEAQARIRRRSDPGERPDGILVVADAAHADDSAGGWGRPGSCDGAPCGRIDAGESGRAVYVGAADFHPAWPGGHRLDLVEHEIGHALDLPHSGPSPSPGDDGHDRYVSALDVMSDSTARRVLDEQEPSGPDTIAANRVGLGWIGLDDVVVVTGRREVELRPSTADSGTRAAVIALDDHRLVTIELLTPTGLDAHLSAAGIAVHLVDQRPGTGDERVQVPLVGTAPYADLLQAGESFTLPPELSPTTWSIQVRVISPGGATVAVLPA